MSSPFTPKNFQKQAEGARMSKEEEVFLGAFDEMYGEAKQAKKKFKDIMEASYLAYRSIMSDFTYSNRNIGKWGLAVFVPYTFQTIAGIEAQLTGRPPAYRIAPVNNPSDKETAEYLGKFSKAEFRRSHALRQIADAVQTSLIFGTAFLRSQHIYDVRKKKFIKIGEDGAAGYEERPKVFYNGWGLTNDHPLKVYLPNVHEHDPKKWPYYIVREMRDVREMKAYYENHPELCYKTNYKALKAGGDLTDDLQIYNKTDIMYRMPTSRYPGTARDLDGKMFPRTTEGPKIDTKYLVETFRVFSEQSDEWAVVANGRVIEYHPNPLESIKELPVVAMRDYEIKNVPWGMGEPELLRWLQFEANALHNLGLDSAKYSASPVFAMNSAYLRDETEFEIVPGKIIHLKNIQNLTVDKAIQTLNTGEVKSSLFKLLEINEDVVRKTSGAGSFVVGGDSVNPTSATESNNLKAASTTRIYDRARRIEQDVLTDIIRHQIAFFSDTYTEEMAVKITDDESIRFLPGNKDLYDEAELNKGAQIKDAESGEVVTPGFGAVVFGEDAAEQYDVYIEGESTMPLTKDGRKAEGMQLLKLASEARRPLTVEEMQKYPQMQQAYPQGVPILDAEVIATDILMPAFSTVDNVDHYVWKIEEGAGGAAPANPVGRPEDPFKEVMPNQNPADVANGDAQPNNLLINKMEQV